MRKHIEQSNLIESVQDPQEVTQSLKAWHYLERQPKLTNEVVLKTHGIIMDRLWPQIAGRYRSVDVVVGGRVCPPWALVQAAMDEWLSMYHTMEPKQAHISFEHIHPFRDGNGRTGRMLMWWQETQLAQEPTLIEFKNRFRYYRWF